jgi:hypothetical protein
MCRFLSWDFEYRLRCPVDRETRTVKLQSRPDVQGHFLDVVSCSAVPEVKQLGCEKQCRDAIENGEYWNENYA